MSIPEEYNLRKGNKVLGENIILTAKAHAPGAPV